MIEETFKSFIALLIIMNPFSSVPFFITVTQKLAVRKINRAADEAASTALVIVLVFLFAGQFILKFFGVSMDSFMVAGGIILLILGIKYSLNIRWAARIEKYSSIASVPIGTPLTAGPGTITTVMLLVHQYGILAPLVATFGAIFIIWLTFRYSRLVITVLGHQGTDVFSRIMGMLIIALAVEYLRTGLGF